MTPPRFTMKPAQPWPELGRLPIMPAMCHTCPWQTNGHAIQLNPGRVDEIQAYLREGTTHRCHGTGPHGTTGKGPEHTCRGSVNYMNTQGIHTEEDRVQAIIRAVTLGQALHSQDDPETQDD